ncbi:MAG TPA: pectate lyase [Bacteroidota bacterium]|nr:pectate lyase [Bacteroidota bacterium]
MSTSGDSIIHVIRDGMPHAGEGREGFFIPLGTFTLNGAFHRLRFGLASLTLCVLLPVTCFPQYDIQVEEKEKIDTVGLWDGAHHWYSIYDTDKVIQPLPGQRRYADTEYRNIADNILLYQKVNGGWPKNYDMRAVLSPAQQEKLRGDSAQLNTTFDNGATHSQIVYLAKVYAATKDPRYRDGALRGIDFILSAQYPNGGWPQFYPDTSGYRKYITFNDGAMSGVMRILCQVVQRDGPFSFVDGPRLERCERAFENGVSCIMKCQIREEGIPTIWGQQHNDQNFSPEWARTFEPPSLCAGESSDILLLLMEVGKPGKQVIEAVQGGVRWLVKAEIHGIRVKEIPAPFVRYTYQSTRIDRVVEIDSTAPPIWARLYELGTDRPLFCSRGGKIVYSLADVDRERRAGYSWYTYAPERVFERYAQWQRRWAPGENVLAGRTYHPN